MDDLNKQLLNFATFGNLENVILSIYQGANVEATDNDGQTALTRVAGNGHLKIVQYLLEVESNDNHLNTALRWAAYYGRTEIVQYLLDQEADLEAMDNKGMTALMCAEANGRHEVVSFINSFIENQALSDTMKTNQSQLIRLSF